MKKRKIFLYYFVIGLAFIILLSSCKQNDIGKKVDNAPITALSFEAVESFGQTFYGVIYREVNNPQSLIAKSDALLIAFLDNNLPSNLAMPFLETLCDNHQDQLKIMRVNVELTTNESQVNELKSMFEIQGYPYFVLISKGMIKNEFLGFDDEMANAINKNITDFLYNQ